MTSGERGHRRIGELKDEIDRIEDKIKFAASLGAEEEVDALAAELDDFRSAVATASLAEARRELEAGFADVEAISAGVPRKGGNHPGNDTNEGEIHIGSSKPRKGKPLVDPGGEDGNGGDGNGGDGNGGNGGDGNGGNGGGDGSGCCGCSCNAVSNVSVATAAGATAVAG